MFLKHHLRKYYDQNVIGVGVRIAKIPNTSYKSLSPHSLRASVDELTLQGELKVAIGYWWFLYILSRNILCESIMMNRYK